MSTSRSRGLYYYPTPGLSTDNYFRGGDTITDLTGVMEYSFGAWKLRPVPGFDHTFQSTTPRPVTPDGVDGRLHRHRHRRHQAGLPVSAGKCSAGR